MHLFANASCLLTNMDKTELYRIQCQDMGIQGLLEPNQAFSTFPYSYLGLPLYFKRLPKSAMFPLIQRIGNRLIGWKRNMLAYSRGVGKICFCRQCQLTSLLYTSFLDGLRKRLIVIVATFCGMERNLIKSKVVTA
jgi:hypothetical protein